LIGNWDSGFEWVPGEDRGILVHDRRGRLIDRSSLVERLRVR